MIDLITLGKFLPKGDEKLGWDKAKLAYLTKEKQY